MPRPRLAAQHGHALPQCRDQVGVGRARDGGTSTMPWSAVMYSAVPAAVAPASCSASRSTCASWNRHAGDVQPAGMPGRVEIAGVDHRQPARLRGDRCRARTRPAHPGCPRRGNQLRASPPSTARSAGTPRPRPGTPRSPLPPPARRSSSPAATRSGRRPCPSAARSEAGRCPGRAPGSRAGRAGPAAGRCRASPGW